MTTDPKAVAPLTTYLALFYPGGTTYYEPCVGNRDLIRLLGDRVTCVGSSDDELDARVTKYQTGADLFITNPPWSRDLLHPIIENLRNQRPTWLLFDSDWMFTKQANPYLDYCKAILSVGRVKWIPDSKQTGKDNCAWYLFTNKPEDTHFIALDRMF